MADDLERDRQMLAELMEARQKRGEIRDDFTADPISAPVPTGAFRHNGPLVAGSVKTID